MTRAADHGDTICAIATPPGSGGIGIVRLSGPGALELAAAVAGAVPPPRRARLRDFVDANGETIDRGLLLHFAGPASFTGEDVVEFQCHGGRVVLDMLQHTLLEAGARLARPGEFTQRAFLNDRLDLAQAEAVADLIAAGSRSAARAAKRSLEGHLSREVEALQNALTELRVHIEGALDFPDEEVDFIADSDIGRRLGDLLERVERAHAGARAGAAQARGIRIAIVGAPNAGKSSLLNALVERDAAIVTAIPGTTRDIVREPLEIRGVPVEVLDTAGLRATEDPVEAEGVRRTQAAMAGADGVLWVRDAAAGHSSEPAPDTNAPVITVWNKIDLLETAPTLEHADSVAVSAQTRAGLETLEARIASRFGGAEAGEAVFSARPRQVQALAKTQAALATAADHLRSGTAELIAEELTMAQRHLGEITGGVSSEQLLGEIFSRFCIGK